MFHNLNEMIENAYLMKRYEALACSSFAFAFFSKKQRACTGIFVKFRKASPARLQRWNK
jgi:hypothetical protein